MADGRDGAPGYGDRRASHWAEIFRCFQVALDPRKLLAAAAGILTMSLGWYLLSTVFYYDKPVEQNDRYQADAKYQLGDKRPDGKEYTPEEYVAKARQLYQRDVDQWKVLNDLAGPGEDGKAPSGRLRTLPWYEYRGENPYLLVSRLFSGNPAERTDAFDSFWSATVPVLFEPLVKLIDANASFQTRAYLLLCLVWSLATWAFFGGIITRIAAVQLTGKDRVTLSEAARYVVARYPSYVLSPLVPLGIIAAVVLGLMLYGLVAMIPVLGDEILYGLGLPLVLVGGLVIAILLVGLVGYPLMYATISTEGSDTFDALSRAYNYVFQAPWHYLWYSTVAVLYGAAVTLFVVFLASLTVYMSKWAVSQAPGTESFGRKPDFLFLYAPESFGWRELFLKGSSAEVVAERRVDPETNRPFVTYVPRDPVANETYRKHMLWGVERVGAGMVSFWLTLVFLLMLGFSYSYFWSAATAIYLLMRKKVDETDLDEIYIEEDLPEGPLAPPATPSAAPAPTGTSVASLPTVPPTPAPATTGTTAAAPAAPATVPFTPPSGVPANAGLEAPSEAAPPTKTATSTTIFTTKDEPATTTTEKKVDVDAEKPAGGAGK